MIIRGASEDDDIKECWTYVFNKLFCFGHVPVSPSVQGGVSTDQLSSMHPTPQGLGWAQGGRKTAVTSQSKPPI